MVKLCFSKPQNELYVIPPPSIEVIIWMWCDLDCIFVVCAAIGCIFWIAAAAPGPVNHSFFVSFPKQFLIYQQIYRMNEAK
jgi:hypothetical protein